MVSDIAALKNKDPETEIPMENEKTVYVSNLSKDVSKYQLYQLFCSYGRIVHMMAANHHRSKKSKHTFGYVHYWSSESARQAVKAVDGVYLKDSNISVKLKEGKPIQTEPKQAEEKKRVNIIKPIQEIQKEVKVPEKVSPVKPVEEKRPITPGSEKSTENTNNKIFVTNFPKYINRLDIRTLFSKIGPIENIEIAEGDGPRRYI